jgi:hypothetical protein
LASRLTRLPSWYLYKPRKQANLLAKLVLLPAQQAG